MDIITKEDWDAVFKELKKHDKKLMEAYHGDLLYQGWQYGVAFTLHSIAEQLGADDD